MSLPPLAAEKMFEIGNMPITNSYINSTIAVLIFGLFTFLINRAIKKYYHPKLKTNEPKVYKGIEQAPKGILNFFESILEILLEQIDNITKDRKKTLKFLPIVGTLFLFILVSNWLGLLPGTGSFGIYQVHKGAIELIPLLRPANADLNMTLAMAVFAVMGAHIIGIATIGFFKYANKFIKLGDLFHAFLSLNPIKIMVAVIEFFVGFIEIISEMAKMVSLSLRLLGNIFAGEILLTVLAGLIPFFVPLPFMFLEILVGLIQAMVFSILTLVYLVMATAEIHTHAEHNNPEQLAEHN